MTVSVVAASALRLTDLIIPDHLSRELRRSDDFIQLAVLASQQVLAAAPVDGERTGIYLGTAFGPMPCNLAVLDDLVMDDPISPTLFSHSVFNAASGYIARICKIYGPALTLTSFGWPFFIALQAAWQAIQDARLDHALVLQVETYSTLLTDARTAMLPSSPPSLWPAGATAWLLGKEGPCRIEHISVAEEPCSPEARLKETNNHPLAAGEELTTLINRQDLPHIWQRAGAYGRVELKLTEGEE